LAKGLVIAAPGSGSGKTVVTLGLLGALSARMQVAPAKVGPDYIDPQFLMRAARTPAVNLDPFAMSPERLAFLAEWHAGGADLLLVEGVMGLFDGAAGGGGSTADLAATLGLPVVLVVDCARQSQSVAALVSGFANWRADVRVAGVILNRVGSERHETMLRAALDETGIPVLGAIPRDEALSLPDRHLGLVLPGEVGSIEDFIDLAAETMERHVDLDALAALAAPLPEETKAQPLPPLGQRTAIAYDRAFAFVYEHWLEDWSRQGAEVRFFSPLQDEPPDERADAVYLPGGYPELHAAALAAANKFKSSLVAARDRGALIYGECGGYMVLGHALTDAQGRSHEMAGLLPVETRIDKPRRTLGYRQLTHSSALPFPLRLKGHEFHYSVSGPTNLPPLFEATDAMGKTLPPMGATDGRVMGSYAHVIDAA
jgi:cobyrinic acid a,c-diamide synthase